MIMTEETVRIRPDDIVWQDLDGELVILDLRRSAYLATNATGSLLARYLTESRTLAELADHMVAEFGIDRALALADAQAFVAQLREKRLLA